MLTPFLDAILLPKEYYTKMPVRKHTYWRCVCVVGALNICYPLVIENFRALFMGKGVGALAQNIVVVSLFALVVGIVDTFVYCKPLADFLSRIPGFATGRGPGAGEGAGEGEGGGEGEGAGEGAVEPKRGAGEASGSDGAADEGVDSAAGALDGTASASDGMAGREGIAGREGMAGREGAAGREGTAPRSVEVRESAAGQSDGAMDALDAAVDSAIKKTFFVRACKVYALSAIIVIPLAIAVQEAYRIFFYETANGNQLNVVVAVLAAMQVWAFAIMSRGICGILRCGKGVQRAFVFFVVAAWSLLWGLTFSWLVFDNPAVMNALFALLR